MTYDHNPFSQTTSNNNSSANWRDALLYTLGPLAMLVLGLLGDYLSGRW